MPDVFGWIIRLIPSAIKSHLVSEEERKQKHFEDIKEKVFEQMLQILDDTYIPALEGEKAIIVETSRPVIIKGVDATKDDFKNEYGMEIISPYYESRWNFDHPAPEINENLYQDIKENHYEEVAALYEAFVNDFESYGQKWLSYAYEIENKLKSELNLPLYNGDIGKPFVNPKGLAVFTIGKIMGINPNRLFVENQETIMVQGLGIEQGPQIVMRSTEHIKKCGNLINSILEKDEKYDELHPYQEELLNKANNLRNEIDKIIKSYKLQGKRCEYF